MKNKEKKDTIGLTAKKKDFSEWYGQVLQKAELMDYTPVSGSIVIRPNAYHIWETIQKYLDGKLKALGVKNAYFPLLIPESSLMKEKKHIQGFNPEVAWVTQAGNTRLSEKLAIRPTSETIMYPLYSKWIRSHKDLPLKLNQWNNIIRWEFKHPIPFLRTREFLWQEGHSAFASEKEAEKEVRKILDIYAYVFEELLAVPVLKGRKTEREKFAGAVYTLSIETLLPNGKAIQCATTHNLGQNFSKVFDISFLDENGRKRDVWQTSWGLSTRSIGILAAIHGDDRGLVLPPKVSPVQVVIIPIIFEKNRKEIMKKAVEIKNKLKNHEVLIDDGDYSPGWKFHNWELKGIPIRIEIGPKDIAKNQAVLVRRDTGKKEAVKLSSLSKKVNSVLDDIQKNLFTKAKRFLKSSIKSVKTIEEAKKQIKNGEIAEIRWCSNDLCEQAIKAKTGAKILNIPETHNKTSGRCIVCGEKAKESVYIARSY